MSARTKWALAAAALLLAVVFVRLGSPPALGTDTVRKIAVVLGTPSEHQGSELMELVEPDVEVDIAGTFTERGRERVVGHALDATRGKHPVVVFRELSTTTTRSDRCSVTLEVTVSDSQVGDLHASIWKGSAELTRRDGRFRLSRLVLRSEARAEPEPRP